MLFKNKLLSVLLLVGGIGLMLFPAGALLVTSLPCIVRATEVDTTGAMSKAAYKIMVSNEFFKPFAGLLLSAAMAIVYQLLQLALKSITTRWKWTNNKLTVSLFWKLASILFGKSILYYRAEIDSRDQGKVRAELRKKVKAHLEKHGGEMVKAFNEALSPKG